MAVIRARYEWMNRRSASGSIQILDTSVLSLDQCLGERSSG